MVGLSAIQYIKSNKLVEMVDMVEMVDIFGQLIKKIKNFYFPFFETL